MPGDDNDLTESVARSVTAGRDAYVAGHDIAVTNYTITGNTGTTSNTGPGYRSRGANGRDAAFRTRVDNAVEELAEAVGAQWRSEERLRRVHDPLPLPVRWTAADPLLSDHPENIYRLPDGTAGLDGSLPRVAEGYQAVESRRLVVIGQPGAGKSVFTIRLTLDLLKLRQPGDEVPVIFGLHTWNPLEQSLQDWMAARLANDYPALSGTGPGKRTIASELVRRRLVLPVLDGLDEVSAPLRGAALHNLNLALDEGDPVIVTCREADYRDIVADEDVLTSAAVVSLLPLGLSDLADYLPRTTKKLPAEAPPGFATKWDPVIERLRAEPADPACQNLLAVLSTPLMTSLARSVYSDTDADPATLLDGHLASRPAIEAHLLDAFIPAAFTTLPAEKAGRRQRRSDPDDAERWLTFLARHLDRLGTRDLRWWRLQDALPAPLRWLATGLAAGTALYLVLRVQLQYDTYYPNALESITSPENRWSLAACLGIGSLLGLAVTTTTASAAPRRRPATFGRTALRRVAYVGAFTVPAGLILAYYTNFGAYEHPYYGPGVYPTGLVGLVLGLAYSAIGGFVLGAVTGTAGIEARQAPMTTPFRLRRRLRAVSRRLAYGIGRGLLNGIVLVALLMATWLAAYAGTLAVRLAELPDFPPGGAVHSLSGGGTYADYPGGLRYIISANGSRKVVTTREFTYYIDESGDVYLSENYCTANGNGPCRRSSPENVIFTYDKNVSCGVVDGSCVYGYEYDNADGNAHEISTIETWVSSVRPQFWTIIGSGDNKEYAGPLAVGFILIGIMSSLFVWLGFPVDVTQAVSPRSTVASDRNAAIFRGVLITLLALSIFFYVFSVSSQFLQTSVRNATEFAGITMGVIAVSLSPWVRFQVARFFLAATGRVPWRLMAFLDEAHSRGALRQAGAVYQFRHVTLQERLVTRSRGRRLAGLWHQRSR